MSALTGTRNTPRRDDEVYEYDVKASTKCYGGGIAVLDAAGNVYPGATATGLIAVGRFEDDYDNSSGAAGDIKARVRQGVFRYENSTSTDAITKAEIGDDCYIVDDQTVAKTDGSSTRSKAGKVVDVDSVGVWVAIGYEY